MEIIVVAGAIIALILLTRSSSSPKTPGGAQPGGDGSPNGQPNPGVNYGQVDPAKGSPNDPTQSQAGTANAYNQPGPQPSSGSPADVSQATPAQYQPGSGGSGAVGTDPAGLYFGPGGSVTNYGPESVTGE